MIIVALLVSIGLFSRSQPSAAPAASYVSPSPIPVASAASSVDLSNYIGAVADNLTLGIANLSDQDWVNCSLTLNPSTSDDGFTLDTSITIAAHKATVFPLTDFSKSDGARFDSNTHATKMVLVNCGGLRVGVATVRKASR